MLEERLLERARRAAAAKHAQAAEEAEVLRGGDVEGPRPAEKRAQRAGAEARRAAQSKAWQVATGPARESLQAETGPEAEAEAARRAAELRLSSHGVVRAAVDSMISAARNLGRPDSGDVIWGVVGCVLAIGIGVAVALAT
jgi:hypothetical protein